MQRRESDSSISAPHGGSTGGLVTAGAVGAAGAGAGAGVVAGTETLQHEESDRSDGSEHDHDYDMQDEYEEEDRLIAQGGLGIPTDDVSLCCRWLSLCISLAGSIPIGRWSAGNSFLLWVTCYPDADYWCRWYYAGRTPVCRV